MFLLRNVGILGGVLLLLAEGRPGARYKPHLQLAARVAIALHGLEIAPSSDVLVVLLCDLACYPLTLMLIAGLRTRMAAGLLAAALLISDLSLNHWWWGFRYNDSIRYYFFEDASLLGGLVLVATFGGGDFALDVWRKRGYLMRDAKGGEESSRLLAQEDEEEEY